MGVGGVDQESVCVRGQSDGGDPGRGISVVSIDYRLTPEHTFPAQMDDVVRAVQFVRSRAQAWNLDPERIAALGGSAGAHLAAWVALHDDMARSDSANRWNKFPAGWPVSWSCPGPWT